MQTNPVLQRAAPGGGALAHYRQLFGHQRRRLPPGQVGIDLIGGNVDGFLRGAAKKQRRAVFLYRRKQHFRAFHVDMLAVIIHLFTFQQARVDVEKFAGDLIAFAVAEENTVAFVFHRIAAGDDVNEQPTARQTVERRRHPRRQRRRLQARTNGHQIAQAAGQRRQRRGHQPGVFAAFPRWDQHAVVAEAIGRQRHLLQVRQINRASALRGAQVAAIAVGGQKPEHVDFIVGFLRHYPFPI